MQNVVLLVASVILFVITAYLLACGVRGAVRLAHQKARSAAPQAQ